MLKQRKKINKENIYIWDAISNNKRIDSSKYFWQKQNLIGRVRT